MGTVGTVATLIFSIATATQAQAPLQAQVQPPSGSLSVSQTQSQSPKRPQSDARVTLAAKDSTLSYVVRSLAHQANFRLAYDNENPIFKKRITIDVRNKAIMDAMADALQGTGLTARISTDGGAILIRAESPAKKNKDEQTGTMSGRIIDSATKRGIAGATVLVVGAKTATTTGEDGSFTLTQVPVGSQSLSVRLLGYHTRTLSVTVDSGAVARITIALQQTSTTLTEVVTTATGTQRRAEISNDVVVIDADKLIQTAPIRSVTDLLVAAQVPGMIITPSSGEPGAPPRIRLGGVGSISQNNDPVVIVDGVWIKSAFSSEDLKRQVNTGSGNPALLPSRLDGIDPSTIETIEIVRGPSAATLYGPDAANGVIKITTKRGRAGKARWDIRVAHDGQSPTGNKPLIYVGYGRLLTSTVPRECSLQQVKIGLCIQDSVVAIDQNSPLMSNEGHGVTNSYSMTVSGGSDQITYSVTGSFKDALGVRRIAGADRVRLRQLNVPIGAQLSRPSKLTDRLLSSRFILVPSPTLEVSLNLDGGQSDSRANDITARAFGGAALSPTDTISTLTRPTIVTSRLSNSVSTRGLASLSMRWNPQSWWSTMITTGIDRDFTRESGGVRSRTCADAVCGASEDRDQSGNTETSIYTARVQATFIPSLGWASRFLSIRPGVSMDLRRETRDAKTVSLDRTTGLAEGTHTEGPYSALAGIGMNMYIRLFDRLSFDPGLRRDFGNGKGLENKAKTYPRFGTSWLISDESFFPTNSWVTSLRLRSAMGFAAVQPNLAALRGLYSWRDLQVDGKVVRGLQFDAPGNNRLQPERSFEIEYGFDADLFDDRVTLTVTSANKQNTNTLIDRMMAPSVGTGGQRQENVARVVNRRTDVQVTARVIERPGFTARITANLSAYDNRVKTLGDGVSPFGENEQRYVSGYPVGGLWGRPVLGVNDINNNGVLEAGEYKVGDTAVYIGTNMPRYTSGYNIELGFGGMFTVNTLFDYKGRYMQNRAFRFQDMLGFWSSNASIADQLIPIVAAQNADQQNVSEIRFQSASITMNVPAKYLRTFKAQSMQISFQGKNLGLWTQYRGRDPGVNSSPFGEQTKDNGSVIPTPRAYSLQIRLGY